MSSAAPLEVYGLDTHNSDPSVLDFLRFDSIEMNKLGLRIDFDLSVTPYEGLERLRGWSEMKNGKVAVVGLGKIGLPLAQLLTRHGFEVKGVETNLEKLGGVRLPFQVSGKPTERLKMCDIVFIIVPTPSLPNGKFSLEFVRAALADARPHLGDETIVAICSSVNVGDIEQLRSLWGNMAYTPLMVAQGTVAKNLEFPEYVLIGSDNPEVAEKLKDLWAKIVPEETPFVATSTRNMEIIKIATNFLLPTKIVLANLIGELCEQCKGDFDEVVQALRLDTRLSGARLWKAGLGFGGPCFPRDVRNFYVHLRKNRLAEVVLSENIRQIRRSVNLIGQQKKQHVAILGITYKPGVSLTDDSQALEIARSLKDLGFDVSVYDPTQKHGFPNAKECIKKNELIFLAVPWEEFEQLKPEDFRKDQVVIDPWRILRHRELPCKYIAYGVG